MDLQIIQNKIITIREKQIILDSDIAELYGVETGIPNFTRTVGWDIKKLNFNHYGGKTL